MDDVIDCIIITAFCVVRGVSSSSSRWVPSFEKDAAAEKEEAAAYVYMRRRGQQRWRPPPPFGLCVWNNVGMTAAPCSCLSCVLFPRRRQPIPVSFCSVNLFSANAFHMHRLSHHLQTTTNNTYVKTVEDLAGRVQRLVGARDLGAETHKEGNNSQASCHPGSATHEHS